MTKIRVAYDSRQTALKNSSFSPSATKPAKVMDAWNKTGIDFEVIEVTPLSRKQMSMVHDPTYVNRTLDLKMANGFGNRLQEVADSLPWVCGSVVSAVDEAVNQGGFVFSPTSGAHHAGYDFNGGFCTFNSLCMGAHYAYDTYGLKVGILDCDAHFGNGTQDIIKHLGWDWTHHFSMGGSNGKHAKYLKKLGKVLNGFKGVDLLIYNAGADAHENDPLGGHLSSKELQDRDYMVLGFCKANRIPVVICLAGGYQDNIQNVLNVHNVTLAVADHINNWSVAEMGHFNHKDVTSFPVVGEKYQHSVGKRQITKGFSFMDIGKEDVQEDVQEDKDETAANYAGGDFLNELDALCQSYEGCLTPEDLIELIEVYTRNMERMIR